MTTKLSKNFGTAKKSTQFQWIFQLQAFFESMLSVRFYPDKPKTCEIWQIPLFILQYVILIVRRRESQSYRVSEQPLLYSFLIYLFFCCCCSQQDSIVDASEDDQIMAAIQASLKDNSKSKPNCVTIDSDSSDDEELETFTDSDDVNSNPSPVKKPRISGKKSPSKKDGLCSKLTNSANSCSSANHKNSTGKKCAKRRRSSDKEEEKSADAVEPERWRNYLGNEGGQ